MRFFRKSLITCLIIIITISIPSMSFADTLNSSSKSQSLAVTSDGASESESVVVSTSEDSVSVTLGAADSSGAIPEICAAQDELKKLAKEAKKSNIKAGLKATGKKIADFSCLKDLWGGFGGGGFDIMAILMKAMAALKDAACAAASNALSGVTGGINKAVAAARDGLTDQVNGYLLAQTDALTGDLQSQLSALEDMTSEKNVQNSVDGLVEPYKDSVSKEYTLTLYD
jgi:hypothetical protein